ncbi:MAG: bifunctional diguanylate cyclase/phosphodiesterase [Nitrospirae bacterium]|nr:bifunctional diguanylate cyclase/phosphodiesterase [Nitrospirota bacterium]
MEDRVVGVINVYVDVGHKKSKTEEQLLLMLADTLAAIIERRMTDEKLEYMANYDALTGIPNRTLLFDRLTQSISQSKRYKDKTAVLYIDLDKFKAINDKHGHDAGDVVLKKATDRLKRSVRDVDTIARLGGDEFAIVVRGFNKLDELTELCNRIIDEIDRPMEYKGKTLLVNASIGISVYPRDGSDSMLLLKKADTAMYNAKTSLGSNFLFYEDNMGENLRERDSLEEDINYAIANNQFVLYYQPMIDLRTGKTTAVEALIRWNHPVFGMIYPDRFISLAEEAGLGIDIDRWAIRTAIEQNTLWHEKDVPLLNIAVNVTCNNFQRNDFVDTVIHLLLERQMDPAFLEIEITECIVNQNIEQTTKVLTQLSNAGIKVSLDEFGAGYSSLIYLKRLPFNKIKLDKSFITDVTHNQDALVIVKTIIDMAHNLKKPVVAEGVEMQEQLELLKSLDCDEAQGYLFSKPLGAEDFVVFEREGILLKKHGKHNSES